MQSRWQISQDNRSDLQTDSATCWERAYVVRSHESTLWSLGCEDACGLCLRIISHCAEPANPWLIYHASKIWPQPGYRNQALTVTLKLSLCLLLFYYSQSPQSRICFTALWNKLPGRAKALGCPLEALVPRCTFSYQSLCIRGRVLGVFPDNCSRAMRKSIRKSFSKPAGGGWSGLEVCLHLQMGDESCVSPRPL